MLLLGSDIDHSPPIFQKLSHCMNHMKLVGPKKYSPTLCPGGRRIRNIPGTAPVAILSAIKRENKLSYCPLPFKKWRWKKVLDGCYQDSFHTKESSELSGKNSAQLFCLMKKVKYKGEKVLRERSLASCVWVNGFTKRGREGERGI